MHLSAPTGNNAMAEDCTLCRVVDQRLAGQRPLYDTRLLETPSFVVIPALGPVWPGHVMVVSRSHIPNLASMPRVGVVEYDELVRTVSRMDSHGLFDVLEAEHGGAEGERGGACIIHVHVNLIPRAGSFVDMFDGELPLQDVDQSLNTLNPGAAPYILLRNSRDVRLYTARKAPSQLIRRALVAKLGREDWDWAVFPHHDVVEATVRMWRFQSD
jgi:diadenosine tetraphosphate (Ap4A) HIT family hydrolase